MTLQSVTRKSRVHPETGEGPAGIYVHIPFCQSKCPYCSFVSYQDMNVSVQNRYMQALKHQAHDMAGRPWSRARKFHSLFIGGGTPSSVDSEKTADFIAVCLEEFNFTARDNKGPEVTLEANPNSLDAAMLDRLRQAGVNRLSIGIQSFSDSMLRNIGRIHRAREGIKAFESARAAGFDNINLDLMYGLPNQDAAQWEKTLQQAVDLAPEHLSVYELTIEQGTPFAEAASRNTLDLPHEEVTLSMFERAQEVLSGNGYRQYEISNYARHGFECIHNINYWENGSYIGLGSSAVSCFSGVRIKSEENPDRFTQMIDTGLLPFKEAEFLDHCTRFRETVIMGLRMTEGVSTARLENQFGLTPQRFYGETLNRLIRQEFMVESDNRLRFTQKGLRLANWVMAQLV